MTKKELNVFEKARQGLIEATKKAFNDFCMRNKMINYHHSNVKIKDLWLTNYEMVKHPTCLFTGVVIITPEQLMELMNDLEEYAGRDLKIEPYISTTRGRLYEIETSFCFDYVTEEVTFAPDW